MSGVFLENTQFTVSYTEYCRPIYVMGYEASLPGLHTLYYLKKHSHTDWDGHFIQANTYMLWLRFDSGRE